ncbi:arginine--tRNA ligase [bacterium]|nr:arginine--tRNA ligase [bacterium]
MYKQFFENETKTALKQAYPDIQECNLRVEKPKNSDFGDFAINVSPLARELKTAPPAIAQNIEKYLSKDGYEVNLIGGFINFKLGRKMLAETIEEIIKQGQNFAKPKNIKPEKINLEYVSANPTGPFHIGHGRWAAMGSALANLLKFYGHDVYQEFYINDAGSQIQKLGNSLLIRLKQLKGENVDFPQDELERKNYYQGEYLIPVAEKFLKENEYTEDVKILSDYAKKEMERLQQELLNKFRVHFDKFYSELDLHTSGKVENSYKKLEESGKLYEKEGAIWFKSSEYGDDEDRVIKKADGSNTYLTADIAYHKDKFDRGFERLINIWGADHHGYVARVKASLEALGYNSEKLEILLGQLVNLVINGEQTRMGKRKNMITLDDLIEEVGVDATRFWMCMRDINNTLDFDIELAKKSTDENPVFYVQYAHARACSILRNTINDKINTETGEKIAAPLTEDEFNKTIENFKAESIIDDVENAKSLILKLEDFKSTIILSEQTRSVYTICRYLSELASEFHSYYTKNRVLVEDKNIMKGRLSIVYATKSILKQALDILAVTAPEKM